MLLNIDNPVYNTIFVFSIIMLLVYIIKPDVVYNNERNEFRQFGTTDGKTLLPIYVIGILMAIILYVFFHYLSLRDHVPKVINNSNIYDTCNDNVYYLQQQQIHQLQNQINNLVQQQVTNQIQNIIQTGKPLVSSILPNNLNI